MHTTTDSEFPAIDYSKEAINTIDVQQLSTIESIETSEASSTDAPDVKPISRARAVSALDVFEIDSETKLIEFLESPISVNGKLTKDVNLNQSTTIESNKRLDLNTKTIRVKSGTNDAGKFHLAGTKVTEFTIRNGHIIGGDTRGLGSQSKSIGLISVDDDTGWNLLVQVSDLTHSSQGGFFKGTTSKIVFDGDVTLENDQFNVRALNMDFKGKFKGTTSANGSLTMHAKSNGGLNLSFNDNKSYDRITMDNRVLNVTKKGNVKLINTNGKDKSFANNIANFSEINVDGTLDATANSPSLRTIVEDRNRMNYVKEKESVINVNRGSVFKLKNLSDGNYGVIYSYNLSVSIDNPKEYDMETKGRYLFVTYLGNKSKANYTIKNSEIWGSIYDTSDSIVRIGNELRLENMVSFIAETVYIDNNIDEDFEIQRYNHLTNYLRPTLIPDKSYKEDKTEKYIIANNATTFFGTAFYIQPNELNIEKPIKGEFIKLEIPNQQISEITTNSNGEWLFDKLSLEQVKGGTEGKVSMVGFTDPASKVEVTIIDKLPPKVTPKVIKVPVGDTMTLNDPKRGLSSYSDETTSKDKLKIDMITGKDERDKMVEKPGVYQADIRVTDEAGNATIVTSDVVVYQGDNPVTTHFVVGEDMTYDYREWMGLEERDRQKKC